MKHVMAMCVVGTVLLMVASGCTVPQEDAKKKDSGVRAAPLILVDKGASLAPIIVFKDAPPRTRQAADELAAYIEKVGGVKPQVIEGLPDPVPEHAIWVGFQPKLKELFPKTDFDFKNPEEILIACDGKNLVIAGRDRWDPQHMVGKDRSKNPTVFLQQEYGTVNAVYTFLQDYLDVRWLWPGEIGEDIIRREKIAFAPFEYRYHPQIRMRTGILIQSGLGDNRAVSFDWGRLQRMNLDSSNPGHWGNTFEGGFSSWWDRFHVTHPEYFALQPDGTRSGSGYYTKICQSNPAVWDQWLDDVAKQLEEDPTLTSFYAGINDGSTSGHCICEKCRAWDVPDAKKRLLTWNGLVQEYVALSDREVIFANTLGRKLRQRYPDKDYYVTIIGYGPIQPAPLKNKPDDNVIMAHVPCWFAGLGDNDRDSYDNEKSSQQFADWAATGVKMVYRPNLPSQGGLYQMLPDVPFGRAMETFRYLADHNCTGMSFDTINECWPTQGPLYYLMAQLAWNPDQDGHAILDDYYRRGFGPAAGQLKAYWTLLEETRNRKVDGKLTFPQAYDSAFYQRATSLLDEADAAVVKAPEIYRRRIAHVRIGLEFTRKMNEVLDLMARYKNSKGEDKEAANRVSALWKEIEPIVKEKENYIFPNYLLRELRPGYDPNYKK